ncbi:MAG: hypothetical protein LBD51_09350, partial [Bifidobacteriaceae bacterium]|nr:hypothetical protein [Bifidobacteriaceae bacterium]
MHTAVYAASTPLYVSVTVKDNLSSTALADSATYARETAVNYAAVATTPAVLAAAARDLGLDSGAAALTGKVSAAAELDTALLKVTATDPDPEFAASIADAVAASLVRLAMKELDPPAPGGTSAVEVEAMGPALTPPTPQGRSQ